ncbi:MAG: DUF5056 domain-containing protein [Bacteroidales bacterium]|jgi:hypothetical protein|nr:DUF5056 domain-containing protein [Bacteroidales bacterium]
MKDNFEDFLKKEISKSNIQIPDNGFSDTVINNLSKRKTVLIGRELIIIFSTIISALIFILINGFNIFLLGLIKLFNSIIHLTTPNFKFVIVLITFSLMSLLISYIELRKKSL